MNAHILTKSDFLDFRHCEKALWLRKRKPEAVIWPAPSLFDQLLMQDGYKVEAVVKDLVAEWPDTGPLRFQVEFQSPEGLYARADMVRSIGGDEIDLFEIKASTSLKDSGGHDHIDDAAFQTLVAERAGRKVKSVSVIHVNKEYVRSGKIDPVAFLTVVDVTADVRTRLAGIADDADTALGLLQEDEIDETGCSCLLLGSRNNHCAAFDYFNPGVPVLSVYLLPRISKKKLEVFLAEDRLALADISGDEVTPTQLPVLQAAKTGAPIVNRTAIKSFLDTFEWPLHFYDYETFASAIPIANGIRPQQAIPVQFSHHLLYEDGRIEHFEFLSNTPGQQDALVAALETSFEPSGSVISWNKSFEMTCNRNMAAFLPDMASFLEDVNARTVDLMDVFKKDYVDIRFEGSTSIKKVLPVLCPHLTYNDNAVHDGAGAMAAWLDYVETDNADERERLAHELRAYCKLDTFAMVEIYRALRAVS